MHDAPDSATIPSYPSDLRNITLQDHDRVLLIALHRPSAHNAINTALIREMNSVVSIFESDPHRGCLVITGSDTVFAAGADIKEMRQKQFPDVFRENYISELSFISHARKPVIAAVAGNALGGGCELAMMCDLIIAADNALFALPEIGLGIMPGAGGTQRLTRALGKAIAMDMCLTGRKLTAPEAERAGLVSRVVPTPELLPQSLAIAQHIASMPSLSALAIKEAIHRAHETTLAEGLLFERRAFHALFATHDQKEGMDAFLSKRPPLFKPDPPRTET